MCICFGLFFCTYANCSLGFLHDQFSNYDRDDWIAR